MHSVFFYLYTMKRKLFLALLLEAQLIAKRKFYEFKYIYCRWYFFARSLIYFLFPLFSVWLWIVFFGVMLVNVLPKYLLTRGYRN